MSPAREDAGANRNLIGGSNISRLRRKNLFVYLISINFTISFVGTPPISESMVRGNRTGDLDQPRMQMGSFGGISSPAGGNLGQQSEEEDEQRRPRQPVGGVLFGGPGGAGGRFGGHGVDPNHPGGHPGGRGSGQPDPSNTFRR